MSDQAVHIQIESQKELASFCERAQSSQFIGFDTEFVSENRYRPQLCLLQVATDDEFAIIDTLALTDLSPFWQMLVDAGHVTIAHAAREEFLFCFRACGKRPKNLFDVQLAAGMVGFEYPAAYGNLVSKILGKPIDKGETRTDWVKRPLSPRQIDYALQDVVHLKPLYNHLIGELERLQRVAWLDEEIENWQTTLEKSETEPQWRKVSGISNLNPKALAIVRELWLARDEEASRRNRSPKRVLPDDLIVELARRGTADPKRLKAIRGFNNRVAATMVKRIAAAIEKANALSPDQFPSKTRRTKTMNLGMLGQLLSTALKIVCRNENIASGIAGTSQDVRDLAAWHMGLTNKKDVPILAQGWRAEIIGQSIEQLIDGSLAIRVQDPTSSDPLVLEKIK
jgi:ribonuclease D